MEDSYYGVMLLDFMLGGEVRPYYGVDIMYIRSKDQLEWGLSW